MVVGPVVVPPGVVGEILVVGVVDVVEVAGVVVGVVMGVVEVVVEVVGVVEGVVGTVVWPAFLQAAIRPRVAIMPVPTVIPMRLRNSLRENIVGRIVSLKRAMRFSSSGIVGSRSFELYDYSNPLYRLICA